MSRSLVSLASVLTLLAVPALATPASQEGADRIGKMFQTYLGAMAGVAKVVPQGETYALTLDAAPLFALGQAQGLQGQASPLALTLTDNGDGTWGVAMDQPLSIQAGLAGTFELKEDVASAVLSGVFDEKLMGFSKLDGTFTGLKVEETISPPDQPPTHAVIAMDKATLTSTGTANPAGGTDTVATAALTGLAEQIDMAFEPGQKPVPLMIKADSLTETATLTGLRLDTLLPLLAWGVAHDTALKAMAYRAEVKPLALAAMPIFQTLSGQATVHMISVDTPLGTVGVQELGAEIELNGLVPEGKFREAISLSGLTLPEGLIPAWVAPVLPQKGNIDVAVTGYDAAAAATLALGVLDLPDGQDPGPEFENDLLAALLPKGAVTISLNPGAVEGDGYKLSWQGSMDAGPASEIPTGKATITLTGYDKLQAALNAAPDDVKMQAMMGMGAMRGLAKVGDGGALSWEIDASVPGQVMVNGMDVTKMGGGN